MKADELRSLFLKYFESLNHQVLPSSPVVPKSDPTLLFANAGMNQFKDVFLGNEVRAYKRATTVQKCIRAGGKHNDLDEVGKDGRHLTFFEMLGNWSFGDYGKKDAIRFAWDFLTKHLHLPEENLYVSIYKDDNESFRIWHEEIGLAENKIARFGDISKGDEENFWSMGPVGPCGPCTEIYIDKTPELPMAWGNPFPEDRYLELWNNVFMSCDRAEDGTLTDLPMCSVDTGMGLERIVGVMQHVDSVYETDLFKHILESIAKLLGKNLTQKEILESEDVTAYRVIADHIRTLTFAVSEGQPFSNEGRGYVLRRILRRAVRYGRKLGFEGPFLYKVSQAVVEAFSGAYPEIALVAKQTQEVLRIEEERFFRTLDRGIAKFEEIAAKSKDNTIAGKDAFTLYDTFGFPVDLTEIMAEERGMHVDSEGFNAALEEQRQRSAESAKFVVTSQEPWTILQEGITCEFVGYHNDEYTSDILRYRIDGDICEIILRNTPFYAEGGGELGDHGTLTSKDGRLTLKVVNTVRTEGGITHICEVEDGFITTEVFKQPFVAKVCPEYRADISANHSATHLLQAALRNIVSKEIFQAGSMVSQDRLRFDFTFPRALTKAELQKIENWVNAQIQRGLPVTKHENVPIDDAKKMGAMAIFGEKYGEFVRVIQMEDASIECCGGIHVDNTASIQRFRITQESAVAAGTRRIEAVTRTGAFRLYEHERELIQQSCAAIRCDVADQLPERIQKALDQNAELEKTVQQLSLRIAQAEISRILATARDINGTKVCAARVNVRDRKELLTYADLLRDKMGSAIAMIGAEIDGKPALTCIVSDDKVKSGFHAGKLVGACAAVVGGKGGGRPNTAQAGGTDVAKLDAAIQHIFDEIAK